MSDDATDHDRATRGGSSDPNRRRLLRGAAAAGVGLVGLGATSGSAGATADAGLEDVLDSTTGSLFVGNCPGPWEDAPDEYPTIDLTTDDPETGGAFPDGANEIAIYVHGFLEEFAGGSRNQAYTLETAFRRNGYEAPTVAAFWNSNTPSFGEAKRRADDAGRRLAAFLEDYLDDCPETTVRLVGHSLGSRVSLEALSRLDEAALESVALLGAAVDPDAVCEGTPYAAGIDESAEAVHSYHSRNDAIVCRVYAASERTPALGCDGASCDGATPETYADVDATDAVAAHCDYMKPDVGVVPQIVENFDRSPGRGDGRRRRDG